MPISRKIERKTGRKYYRYNTGIKYYFTDKASAILAKRSSIKQCRAIKIKEAFINSNLFYTSYRENEN
jgi:hypothetical protein